MFYFLLQDFSVFVRSLSDSIRMIVALNARKQSLCMKSTGCDSNSFVQITTGVPMSPGTKKDAMCF